MSDVFDTTNYTPAAQPTAPADNHDVEDSRIVAFVVERINNLIADFSLTDDEANAVYKHLSPTAAPPSTAKEMLDAIDNFFISAPTEERKALWDILTALRGPDDEASVVKDSTTNVIRHHAFPKGRPSLQSATSIGINADNDFHAYNRFTHNFCSHFTYHAQNAFRALGLSWDRTNQG